MHINLKGNVNTKNCIHCADTNPYVTASVPLFDGKVTVWCGILGTVLFGPYFLEEATPTDFVTCSITSSHFIAVLQNYVIPVLLQRDALSDIIWMQDCAPPHIAGSVKRLLDQHFGDRIISRHYPFPWPARSPDLTPMDF